MLSSETIRVLLPVLLGLPALAALVLLAVRRHAAARTVALLFALVHLALTALVIFSAITPLIRPVSTEAIHREKASRGTEAGPVFLPEYVPGHLPEHPHSSVFVGIDSPSAHRTAYNLLSFGEAEDPGDTPEVSARKAKIRPIQFFIGLDGLNIGMLGLCSLLMVPIVLASWTGIREKAGNYFAWLFLLQSFAIGVFLSFDIVLFYVFFELTLVPLYFLVGGWGLGPTRREAARKLFLYTLGGGLVTLVGIAGSVLFVYNHAGVLTFSIPELAQQVATILELAHRDSAASPQGASRWAAIQYTEVFLFLALAVGFAVKIPLVPFHTWLPPAYSEAPIGVTVMMSAILAKMGTFGLLRICLPLAPDATLKVGIPLVGVLAAVGILYAAFCAFAQTDFKKMAAYSSVSHLGFCALAIVAFNHEGMAGGMLHMINHGLTTGALFVLIGMLVDRYGTTRTADYSGLWARLPKLTFFMMVTALASVGLPGLNNFVSEMLMFFGLFDLNNAHAVTYGFGAVAGFGIFLSAWYMLTFVQRVFFGPLREPPPARPGATVSGLNRREFYTIAPLAFACLLLGLVPKYALMAMDRDITALAGVAEDARKRAHADHAK